MTAAIAAGQLGQAFSPARGLPATEPANNKFFESWVEQIDIAGLLGTRDLDADPQADVHSVLDSTVLDQIAAGIFDFPAGSPPAPRKYLANPLHVLVTLTNLRGVPYRIHFQGERNHLPQMMMHGDYMRFAVSDGTSGLPRKVRRLPPGKFDDPNWKLLAAAALATGAFPVGLAPRPLSRLATEYADRKWLVLEPVEEDGRITKCGDFEPIPPDFPNEIQNNPGFQYDFLCIDGGAVDDEPLEKGRRILEGDRLSSSSESRGDQANRALIAIAPFPDLGSYPVQEPPVGNPFLLDVIWKTINSEIQQARFQPAELKALVDESVFNRYLIAPNRQPVPGAKIQSIIASASLGGFGGFLFARLPGARLPARAAQLPRVPPERVRPALRRGEEQQEPHVRGGLDRGCPEALWDRGAAGWPERPAGDGTGPARQGLLADHPPLGHRDGAGDAPGLAELFPG